MTGELAVVLITLSEPRAERFAELMADVLTQDGRFEVIGASARRGWLGGGADILVEVSGDDGITELDAAVDAAVGGVWPQAGIAPDAAVMVQVVRAGEFETALSDGHVTMRQALHGMGLY